MADPGSRGGTPDRDADWLLYELGGKHRAQVLSTLAAVGVPDGERIVGRGWHERAGGPHAEITALLDAGDRDGSAASTPDGRQIDALVASARSRVWLVEHETDATLRPTIALSSDVLPTLGWPSIMWVRVVRE